MLKSKDVLGFLAAIVIALVIGAVVVLRVSGHRPRPAPPPPPPPVAPAAPSDCRAPAFAAAAAANAASLQTLAWSPFGPAETGWATYAPLVAREIHTACSPASEGFAAALARWGKDHGVAADGAMTVALFEPMRVILLKRRPFVLASAGGACPGAATSLAAATPAEGYSRKLIQLEPGALAAYRRLAMAAREAVPSIARDPQALTIFSGYRGPGEEAARCAGGGCNSTTRAHCSAHRTGRALDLYLGHAEGFDPASTAEANRRYQAATPAYRWLVDHADAYGFVPYPFEPWHWEWTGEAP